MGRGRAKAKQTKVARELKYRTYEPDLDALQRELTGREDDVGDGENGDAELEDEYGGHHAYADNGSEDDAGDDGSLAGRQRGG